MPLHQNVPAHLAVIQRQTGERHAESVALRWAEWLTVVPNNSFKPTPQRGGLTQALGALTAPISKESILGQQNSM